MAKFNFSVEVENGSVKVLDPTSKAWILLPELTRAKILNGVAGQARAKSFALTQDAANKAPFKLF